VDVAGKISCSVCSGSSTRSFCIQQP
jgi:hypothetical protein